MRRDFPFNSLNVTNWGQWQRYKPKEETVYSHRAPNFERGHTYHFTKKMGKKQKKQV